ncbi:MAG: beta-galactosidase trimerization domain-containing protein, partial [Planctomycetota bacterium]|nr:beta-galactosidase trimerization domain-containing protein [Planctomycetota bacterium]
MHLLETLCGYDYTFVSDAQILKGELAKYRMLVMPTSFAVGDKVGAKLREFTTGGGTLLADVRPGIFDTSGKWDESQSVSAIFGLSYQKSLGRKLVRGEIRGSLLGTNVRITPEQPFPVDPATELKGATALCHIDGVPVVTVNEIGKGKAICLNIPFTFYSGRTFFDCQYAYWGHPDHNALMVPLLRNLMRASGIERPIKIETDNISEWPFGLEIARLPEGQAEYLGLTKKRQSDGEPSRRITVYSSQKGHVYDMLHGDYLGEREFWDIAIQQADVRLFAVLPYRLEQLAVALAPETVRQGDAIRGS